MRSLLHKSFALLQAKGNSKDASVARRGCTRPLLLDAW